MLESKAVMTYFVFVLLRPRRNDREQFQRKEGCWFSRNSEVEVTWTSLIGWPHKTSTNYLQGVSILNVFFETPARISNKDIFANLELAAWSQGSTICVLFLGFYFINVTRPLQPLIFISAWSLMQSDQTFDHEPCFLLLIQDVKFTNGEPLGLCS